MIKRVLSGLLLLSASAGLLAQTVQTPQNVVQLQASSSVEAQQDLLTLRLSTARDGASAAAVQNQLAAAVDAALAEARKTAQPRLMEARTDDFGLFPRRNQEGKFTGWSGTAGLVLEGRDVARITDAASRIQSMAVSSVSFSLSREQRSKVETEAQNLAIERFKTKAAELARAFGFSSYTLREVAVTAGGSGFVPLAMDANAASRTRAVPVEPGKTSVVVTVSGTVQLR